MQKSMAKNSIFYFIYNVMNMLFPFVTSMYVARVLTPVSIGEVAYAQNIVSYFSILAFLGIPTYGLREIAKVRNNKRELNKLFSELFVINLISTFVFTTAYYVMIYFVESFRRNFSLYAIVGLTVVFNMLNIGWLYEGLEEFQYVSLRNAAFKLIMFALLLLLVHEKNDILPYASINVVGVAGNNIINVIHARKIVRFDFKRLNLKRHMRSIFTLVAVNLAIEIYTLLDTTMLGVLKSKENVTFYTYASRINRVLLQITNSITMVLVPRISYYYAQGMKKDFNILLTKALKILLIIGCPMIIGIQFTSDFLFVKIFGDVYIRSAQVEKILCFVLLISPIGYLLGSRVLLVSGNEDKMIRCVGAGAVINAIGNYALITLWAERGAALASSISEIVVAVLYVGYGRKVFKLQPFKSTVLKVFGAVSFEFIFLLLCNIFLETSWLMIIIEVFGSVIVYMLVLLVERESFLMEYLRRYLKKI